MVFGQRSVAYLWKYSGGYSNHSGMSWQSLIGIRARLSQAGISYQSHRVEKQSYLQTVKHTVTWKGGVDSRPIRQKEGKRALSVWYKSQELTYACTHGFSLKKKKVHSLAIPHILSSDKKILRAKQHILMNRVI